MATQPLTPAAVVIELPSGHTERDRNHTDRLSLRIEIAAEPRKGIRSPRGQAAQEGQVFYGIGDYPM